MFKGLPELELWTEQLMDTLYLPTFAEAFTMKILMESLNGPGLLLSFRIWL